METVDARREARIVHSVTGHKDQPMHWRALFAFIACGGAMLSFFGYGIMSRMMTIQEETISFERDNRQKMTEAFAGIADAASDSARASEATSKAVSDLSLNQRATVKILQEMRDDQRKGVWRATEPPAPSELPRGIDPAKGP